MKRKLYHFATIELGETYQGPGIVIGVMAIAASDLTIHCQFRDDPKIDDQVQSIKADFKMRSKAASHTGLNGIELFRSFTTPRQAPLQFAPRGTSYSEPEELDGLMDILLERYTPKSIPSS